jgi:nucleoside-diphosphate kinase
MDVMRDEHDNRTLDSFGDGEYSKPIFMPEQAAAPEQDTLVILKPDSFWRGLDQQVEARLRGLGLKVVAEYELADGQNLPVDKWKEFYFPAIGSRPPCLEGTSRYMAHGPVKAIRLRGPDAIQRVRKAVGATRPWQAEQGTIRGDFWPGANEANAPYRVKFQQPGDDQFLFNMIHASDSEPSFEREVKFFPKLSTKG